MQLIILVESNSKSKTDYMYIKEYITKYYQSVKINPIFMNGKGNYSSNSIKIKVNSLIDTYKKVTNQKSAILICVDTDNLNNADDVNKTNKIKKYCENNCYEFVFFSNDIEEVFLNKKVNSQDKIKEAEKFIASNKIENVNKCRFQSNKIVKGYSNLDIILSKYLKAKN